MQYKFCVDGEWKHDEHQPYISSEYGVVNTVLLATEPNFGSGVNPLVTAGSSMDVDNAAFNRVVCITNQLAFYSSGKHNAIVYHFVVSLIDV